jgi:hypothetical protein
VDALVEGDVTIPLVFEAPVTGAEPAWSLFVLVFYFLFIVDGDA